jgi:hypothetical protein
VFNGTEVRLFISFFLISYCLAETKNSLATSDDLKAVAIKSFESDLRDSKFPQDHIDTLLVFVKKIDDPLLQVAMQSVILNKLTSCSLFSLFKMYIEQSNMSLDMTLKSVLKDYDPFEHTAVWIINRAIYFATGILIHDPSELISPNNQIISNGAT